MTTSHVGNDSAIRSGCNSKSTRGTGDATSAKAAGYRDLERMANDAFAQHRTIREARLTMER